MLTEGIMCSCLLKGTWAGLKNGLRYQLKSPAAKMSHWHDLNKQLSEADCYHTLLLVLRFLFQTVLQRWCNALCDDRDFFLGGGRGEVRKKAVLKCFLLKWGNINKILFNHFVWGMTESGLRWTSSLLTCLCVFHCSLLHRDDLCANTVSALRHQDATANSLLWRHTKLENKLLWYHSTICNVICCH